MTEPDYPTLLAQKDADAAQLRLELVRLHAQLERLTDAVARSNERISELLLITERRKSARR